MSQIHEENSKDSIKSNDQKPSNSPRNDNLISNFYTNPNKINLDTENSNIEQEHSSIR